MKKTCTENEARYKAEAYCAMAERCLSEVKGKLLQWGVPTEKVDLILLRLVEDNYINEERYAKAFAKEKHRFHHWGRMKIKQALRIKQLPPNLIDEAVDELDKEIYKVALATMLQKKAKEVKGKNDYDRKGKLIRFAVGRGYEMDDILACLNDNGFDDEYLE